ncbi:MAG: class I SAM-dependent methyltransferase [Methanobacteriota archaeon]|nr:MAG: class I SAM-dependent methyltransferase [Euryarchaeota archaeon]
MDQAFRDRDRRHLTYDYSRYRGLDYGGFYEVMYRRMRPVPPIVELGSGLGFFLDCARRHDVRAVGIESSREGIATSAARRLPVVRGDITVPFPFRDDAFGSAFAHHVLEHVPPTVARRVMMEVRRVLKPGGFLFVVSPNPFVESAHDDPDHINLFTPRELRRDLRAAGYRRVSLGTNYWLPFWDPRTRLGQITRLASGALWKVAPIDRFAGASSAMAWK